MATFRVEIEMDGAAFDGDSHSHWELARILEDIAHKVRKGGAPAYARVAKDFNGNTVGQFYVE